MQDSNTTRELGSTGEDDRRDPGGRPELPQRTPGIVPIATARKSPPALQILARVLDGLQRLP